jgi:hypothetical protein
MAGCEHKRHWVGQAQIVDKHEHTKQRDFQVFCSVRFHKVHLEHLAQVLRAERIREVLWNAVGDCAVSRNCGSVMIDKGTMELKAINKQT